MEVDAAPSLDEKIAVFAQLGAFSCTDGEGDDNDTDEIGVFEERNRLLSWRFLRGGEELLPVTVTVTATTSTSASASASASTVAAASPTLLHRQESMPTTKPPTARIQDLTPRRVISAPSAAGEGTVLVRGTGPGKPRAKGRLLGEERDVVCETPQGGMSGVGVKRVSSVANPGIAATTATATATATAAATSAKKGHDSPSLGAAATKNKRQKRMTSAAPRQQQGKMRTEEEQIFKGLSFFYVPDNDIAPARKLRIQKAREYGAVWTRSVVMATHVVVDKNLSFKDVEKLLPKNTSSSNKIVGNGVAKVVNEEYPIDCIQFRTVLDHTQKKYLVAGQPLPVAVESAEMMMNECEEAPQSSGESVISLQLKPQHHNRNKWDYVPPRGTPSQGDGESESSQSRGGGGFGVVEDSQLVVVLDAGEAAESSKGVLANTADTQKKSDLKKEGKEDELAEYISVMQEFKDLPLDIDEDDAQPAVDQLEGTSDGSEDDSQHRRRSMRKTRPTSKAIAFEDRFACNRAGAKDAYAENPNTRTIEILQKMNDYYERVNDHWRTLAYRKAINVLKRQDFKVCTEEEAYRLPSIGRRLAQKIEEIVTTDKLKRLEYAEQEPTAHALETFLGIYGVGNKLAEQWIGQGLRTLEDVKQKVKLTPSQVIGVEHYEDLNTRIPRQEVTELGEVVKKAAEKVDPAVRLIVGGSYRRGAESSNDIDIIVTKGGTESSMDLKPFLDALVRRLKRERFLVAELASSRAGDGSMWHGCCVLPSKGMVKKHHHHHHHHHHHRGIWRRIDFLLVPESEMGGALIYFTGNDIFNRSMRLLASKKGMRLNQRGLYKAVGRAGGGGGGMKMSGGLLEGRDERRIFEILGVKWREPHERWC